MSDWLSTVQFDEHGLIPAIAQDHATGRVLMVAWMNRAALEQTAKTRKAVYWSRSRQKLWHKGEESGNVQQVHNIRLDCDADIILLNVTQQGGVACHTGRESCFYQELNTDLTWQTVEPVLVEPDTLYSAATLAANASKHLNHDKEQDHAQHAAQAMVSIAATPVDVLQQLGDIIQARKQAAPDSSYVASLYDKGLNKILEKIGEEATETILAAKDAQPDNTGDLVYEAADVWFHMLVMLGYFNVPPQAILDELGRRFNLSGLVEKAARAGQS